jgi:hypothetical protein
VACRTFRGAPDPSAGGGLQDALGSLAEADEAVQEAWLGVSRLGAGEIDNLSGQNPACLRPNVSSASTFSSRPVKNSSALRFLSKYRL